MVNNLPTMVLLEEKADLHDLRLMPVLLNSPWAVMEASFKNCPGENLSPKAHVPVVNHRVLLP